MNELNNWEGLFYTKNGINLYISIVAFFFKLNTCYASSILKIVLDGALYYIGLVENAETQIFRRKFISMKNERINRTHFSRREYISIKEEGWIRTTFIVVNRQSINYTFPTGKHGYPLMLFMVINSLREMGLTWLCALWIWIPNGKWVSPGYLLYGYKFSTENWSYDHLFLSK